jgi:salicylate hydroxylase
MPEFSYYPHQSGAPHLIEQHLGQGANQSFEDIYHLTRLLNAYPDAAEDSETLEIVFAKYEQARILPSTMMINTARKQGDNRVVEGVEACLTRNQEVRAFMFMSNAEVMAMYSELYGDLVEAGHTVMGPSTTGESRVG